MCRELTPLQVGTPSTKELETGEHNEVTPVRPGEESEFNSRSSETNDFQN